MIGSIAREVLLQFLIEAVRLTSLGTDWNRFGKGATVLAPKLLEFPTTISPIVVVIGFTVSALTVWFWSFTSKQSIKIKSCRCITL